jgi:Zn-dependent membrane protease YugP
MKETMEKKFLAFYGVLAVLANITMLISFLIWLNGMITALIDPSGEHLFEGLLFLLIGIPLAIASVVFSIVALAVGWKVKKWKLACVPFFGVICYLLWMLFPFNI